MGVIRRWFNRRTTAILSWLAYVTSIAAAVYAWVALLDSLSTGVLPSDAFITNVTVTTTLALYWLILFPTLVIRRWTKRRTTDQLCEEAVKLHRIIERENHLHCNPGYTAYPGDNYAITLHGRLVGLRMAICLLNGWDPYRDADKEGPADELVLAYWETQHAADWASRA